MSVFLAVTGLGWAGTGTLSKGLAISADGTTVVGTSDNGPGNAGNGPVKWTREAGPGGSIVGPTALPKLPGAISCQPNGVSAGAEVIVGQSDTTAVYWTSSGIFDLGHPAGGTLDQALACSASGRYILGGDGANSWIRDIETSTTVVIPPPPPDYGPSQTALTSISSDGTLAVGYQAVTSYVSGIGVVSTVRPVQYSGGVVTTLTLPDGMTEGEAVFVSGDGTTIFGWTRASGEAQLTLWQAGTPTPLEVDGGTAYGTRVGGLNANGTVLMGGGGAVVQESGGAWTIVPLLDGAPLTPSYSGGLSASGLIGAATSPIEANYIDGVNTQFGEALLLDVTSAGATFSATLAALTAFHAGLSTQTPTPTQRTIWLRWSKTRGQTWESAIPKPLGEVGQFYTMPTWRRLGMSRDVVFELSWTADAPTQLLGAFIEMTPSST